MSYDAVLILPATALGVLAGLAALVRAAISSRPLSVWWVVVASVPLAVASFVAIRGADAARHARIRELASGRSGWDRAVAEGMGLWHARDVAAEYAPYCCLALSIGVVALTLWAWRRSGQRTVMARALPLLVVVISVLAPARLAWAWMQPSITGAWPIDDPRWEAGYVAEWARSDLPADGGVCDRYLLLRHGPGGGESQGPRFLQEVLGSQLPEVERACRALCDDQMATGGWNPGVLQERCRAGHPPGSS